MRAEWMSEQQKQVALAVAGAVGGVMIAKWALTHAFREGITAGERKGMLGLVGVWLAIPAVPMLWDALKGASSTARELDAVADTWAQSVEEQAAAVSRMVDQAILAGAASVGVKPGAMLP